MKKYYLCFLFTLALMISLGKPRILQKAGENEKRLQKEEKEYFRTMKSGERKWEKWVKKTDYWKKYINIKNEMVSFPIPKEDQPRITYENGWMEERSYGGKRGHEGCDLMDKNNSRGAIPILSITEGTVEELGWLKLGGYRVGIRSPKGNYYYYAHLDSYSPIIKKNMQIHAGQLLGYMGDSGYGVEGTKGKFPVHLHVGIYVKGKKEYSVNPYYLLKELEQKKEVR